MFLSAGAAGTARAVASRARDDPRGARSAARGAGGVSRSARPGATAHAAVDLRPRSRRRGRAVVVHRGRCRVRPRDRDRMRTTSTRACSRDETLVARIPRRPDRRGRRHARVMRTRAGAFPRAGRRVDAAARQRQPARALPEMPVPVLCGERAASRRGARRRRHALAARARPVPARAVRDVLPRVAGARPRPHHAGNMGEAGRCSRRSAVPRCDRWRRRKRHSSARACLDRRWGPASPIACLRWKPSAAPRSASG